MTTWSFYDEQTGLFTGRIYSGALLKENTPAGCGSAEGAIDHLSQRVELATGEIIDYQPPPPDVDHEWDTVSRRNVLKPEVAVRRAEKAVARTRINELERAQLRPLRELAIDAKNAEAAARLADIDTEIRRMRATLTAETGTTSPEG